MAARRALELAGLRLSLRGWMSLARQERERLVLAGAADAIDVSTVATIARAARPLPEPREPVSEPSRTDPPASVIHGLGAERPMLASLWMKLRPLERFALAMAASGEDPEASALAVSDVFDAVVLKRPSARPAPLMTQPPPAPTRSVPRWEWRSSRCHHRGPPCHPGHPSSCGWESTRICEPRAERLRRAL